MAAEFIAPVVETLVSLLQRYTPGTLAAGREPFVDFGRQFTGVVNNAPALWVMPVRTAFDEDSQQLRHQAHQVQVKLAVTGSEPDDLADAAMAYVRSVDLAIEQSCTAGDWQGKLANGVVLRVWVTGHDYGPLFERGGTLARFPEVDVVVETEELP